MIVIKPIGGLCNRMRAIDSALAFAEVLNTKVKVVWEKNVWLNAGMADLFEDDFPFEVVELDMYSSADRLKGKLKYPLESAFSGRAVIKGVQKFLLSGYQLIYPSIKMERVSRHMQQTHPALTLEILDHGVTDSFLEDTKDLTITKDVYITSGNRFYYHKKHPYFYLKPQKDIVEKVEDFARDFEQTIGLHVRRTDHTHQNSSPDEAYIRIMNEELAKDKNTNFFLATDSEQVTTNLKSEFGDKILTYEHATVARDSLAGIKGAMIDIYLLAKTQTIYGSYLSSFSYTAAEISGIPFHTVKQA